MIDPKALRALSYFSLVKLEKIYRDYFDYDEDIGIFEGITEASSCLIPHKNMLESYTIFKQILEGTNGFHILGISPRERVLMLIEMMKIYERNQRIENLITHHFSEKSKLYFIENKSVLKLGQWSEEEKSKRRYPIYRSDLINNS
jgi:hypothetical protein